MSNLNQSCPSIPCELLSKFSHRNKVYGSLEEDCDFNSLSPSPKMHVFNPYREFKEFSRQQIKDYEAKFKKHDINKDGFLDLNELKVMMEKLGAPQSHLTLKQMIAEVDEDMDTKINFREFLLIFRKGLEGDLASDGGLSELAKLVEIDVHEVGVVEAKKFFQAKIEHLSMDSEGERQIRQEQEHRRRMSEEKRERAAQFKAKASFFENVATSTR